MQGCFTGQPPGADCVHTGHPLPGWETTGRHSWAGVGEELTEGWKISVQVVVGGKIFKQKAGSEGKGCCMSKESRPAGHLRRCGGCAQGWLALAWASMRTKLDSSLLHLPPTSMPRTTKRHRRLRRSFGAGMTVICDSEVDIPQLSEPFTMTNRALRRRSRRRTPKTNCTAHLSVKWIQMAARCQHIVGTYRDQFSIHLFVTV